MTDGRVDVAYGNLLVKTAHQVRLNNTMGKLRLGKVADLITTANYSAMDIGRIHQSALLTINYSRHFHIAHLAESLANLDMALSYSSVVLPLDRHSNFNFDVNLTNSGFAYSANSAVILEHQSAESNGVRRYSGKVGKGTGSRVQMVGQFSTVGFQ